MRLRLKSSKNLPTRIQASTVAWVNGPNPLGAVVDGILGFDGGQCPPGMAFEKEGERRWKNVA